MIDGKPTILLGAEVENSSSSSLEHMEHVWPLLRALHANAAYVPVSWELIEPQESHFDFTLVDGLIRRARRENLHLVLLWFGGFKNTFGSYAPGWVRTDRARFAMAEPVKGSPTGAFSVFSQRVLAADRAAYVALMRHIRAVDGLHTVVMMQVENEIGLLGSSRDHSDAADRAFEQSIPRDLGGYLRRNSSRLLPELREPWIAAGGKTEGTWRTVFGSVADEAFMAWYYAKYVQSLAAAGKREWPLPVYVNAWVEGEPGTYPMGGPVSRMMDIWRASAPSVDCYAADLYGDADTFSRNLAKYARHDNPVVVVESSPDQASKTVFSAVAGQGAIVFGCYPVESPTWDGALADIYQQLREMTPLLVAAQGTKHLAYVHVRGDQRQVIDFGKYRLTFTSDGSQSPGVGLVLEMGEGDFLLMGKFFRMECERLDHAPMERLWVDEGRFERGTWVRGRRLNGDEYEGALTLGPNEPGYRGVRVPVQIRRAKFARVRT